MRFRVKLALLTLLIVSPIFGDEPGLLASYSDGKDTIQTVVTVPAFVLRDNESVHPQIGSKFTARYEGSIKILRRGTYTFTTDGLLEIDGKQVAAPIALDAGEHALSLGIERKPGPARLQALWSSDQFLPEPIPASVFSHKQTSAQAE